MTAGPAASLWAIAVDPSLPLAIIDPGAALPPGRAWMLGIFGVRVEAGDAFLRAHFTGSGAPGRTTLPPRALLVAGWGTPPPETPPAPPNGIGRATEGTTLTVATDDAVLASTTMAAPTDHAYANVFAKWEPGPGAPRLVECGVELTSFTTPIAGVKHPRAFLLARRPDDPALPPRIWISLSRA